MRIPSTLLAALAAAVLFLSCAQRPEVDRRCSGVCLQTGENPQPHGSFCGPASLCICPQGTNACCEHGPPGVCQAEPCAEEHTCPNVGAGGAGGVGGQPPIAECDADVDCAHLGGTECKKAACDAGKCEVTIAVGPTLSQRYGDCKRRECDPSGAIIELGDDSDYFDDARECTIDFCMSAGQGTLAPMNMPLPDGASCGADGHCYDSTCMQCVDWLPNAQCGNNLVCDDSFWCVPAGQCSGKCGGVCAPCPSGTMCAAHAECASLNCSNGKCTAPSCNDGSKNGGETGVDCGASTCGPCPDGEECHAHGDCISNVCYLGQCQPPSCVDGVQNGTETGSDCGGDCKTCALEN